MLPRLCQIGRNKKTDYHEHSDKEIYRYTKIRNKSRNTHRLAYENLSDYQDSFGSEVNQKTDLHEYLSSEICDF